MYISAHSYLRAPRLFRGGATRANEPGRLGRSTRAGCSRTRLGGSSSRLLFANSAWPRASSRVKTIVVLNNSRSAVGEVSTREQDDGREKKRTNTHYSSFNIRKERPRDVALAQLLRIQQDGAYVRLVVDFASEKLSSRDARLVKALVSGTVRWQRWLDFIVSHYIKGSFNQLEPAALVVLRVGVFELTKMDTPSHAAINEAVELAKHAVRPQVGKLVNAVLRQVAVAVEEGVLPDPLPAALRVRGGEQASRGSIRGLATLHSHPTWLVRRWVDQLGWEDAEALLTANNLEPAYCLRASAAKGWDASQLAARLTQLGGVCAVSPLLPTEFVRLDSGMQAALEGGLIADGVAAVQDVAAGLVVALLDPQRGDRVADVCAAPGGKALLAAARLRGEGEVVAVDINERRLGAVRAAALLQGVGGVLSTSGGDAREWALDPQRLRSFDRVLVDAPCSGLGVLSKRADLRWQRQPEDLPTLIELQDGLLGAAAELVKGGGVLVYSTCSIEHEENQARALAFLAAHPDFELCPPPPGLLPEGVVTAEGFMQTFPHKHHTDGAFAARFRRKH